MSRLLDPAHNGTLVVSGVSSDLTRTPAIVDYELSRFHAKAWNILICGVRHTHSVLSLGDAKLLNHNEALTIIIFNACI